MFGWMISWAAEKSEEKGKGEQGREMSPMCTESQPAGSRKSWNWVVVNMASSYRPESQLGRHQKSKDQPGLALLGPEDRPGL